MADKKKTTPAVADDRQIDIQHMQKRLDLLDRRLDNIDSMVTAVAERIMNRPITLTVACPHCGKNMEIAVIGNQMPARK